MWIVYLLLLLMVHTNLISYICFVVLKSQTGVFDICGRPNCQKFSFKRLPILKVRRNFTYETRQIKDFFFLCLHLEITFNSEYWFIDISVFHTTFSFIVISYHVYPIYTTKIKQEKKWLSPLFLFRHVEHFSESNIKIDNLEIRLTKCYYR